jgi:hypothetical protein
MKKLFKGFVLLFALMLMGSGMAMSTDQTQTRSGEKDASFQMIETHQPSALLATDEGKEKAKSKEKQKDKEKPCTLIESSPDSALLASNQYRNENENENDNNNRNENDNNDDDGNDDDDD